MSDRPLRQRFVADRVTTALADTPVVMVAGPRQSGKTTLVRDLVGGRRDYFTLDSDTTRDGVRADPAGFVRGLDRATIDEVQRAPDLLRAIKQSVDADRRPGRFLLTGSANLLALPAVSESLAGRMEIVTLLPFAQAEIVGRQPAFLERAFAGTVSAGRDRLGGGSLIRAVLTGGYPEMQRRADPRRRRAWAREYVRTIIQRDVRDVADIERLGLMPRLLRALAHHAGQLTNFTRIGAANQLDDKTTKRYVAALEQLFLVRRVEPWFANALKRLVKTPKLHFLDSGLLAAVSGIAEERLARDRMALGPLLETFVFGEILKQATWSDEAYSLLYYRDRDLNEVDIVVENDAGDIIGVEVKASATVTNGDFKDLRKLAGAARDRFKLGVVLHDGDTLVPFGDRLFAAPLSCLWNT